MHQCFGRRLQTVFPNFVNNIPLKSYKNFATSSYIICFEIPYGFGEYLNIQNSDFELLLCFRFGFRVDFNGAYGDPPKLTR